MDKEYYLGLDLGTNSIGWAVTDENYNLIKAKGKDLWGIREFEEAKTAVERRMHRTNRRRYQRHLVRMGLLKDYFHDEIHKVDSYFYQRLENSKFHLDDKDENVKGKYGLFNDKDYTDQDYFREYPTIFHLRRELICNSKEHDVRLVYLAISNMFKHRGHFLNAGELNEENKSFDDIYLSLIEILNDTFNIHFPMDEKKKDIENILSSKDYSRTKKKELLVELLQIENKEKDCIEFVKLLCGLKVKPKVLFKDLIIDSESKLELCFSDYNYTDTIAELVEQLGDYYPIVEAAKELYDNALLSGTMKGYDYLSEARYDEYNKHHHDLKILKDLMKKYSSQEDYDYFFRSKEANTYSAYVHTYHSEYHKQRRNMGTVKIEDLYKVIKKLIADMPIEDKNVQYVLDEMNKENFLLKQLTASNGVIPNQVHAKELKKILANAQNYLPFLLEKDDSGLSVSERIYKLFTFQIPYYIGPTSSNSKTGWVVRKEDGLVLPWNIEDKINIKETSEKFISNMVRRCTYITQNEVHVLPKSSLEYESYCVLNEINNIKINGVKISVELKKDIYNTLFKTGKKVTRKDLDKYLLDKGIINDPSQIEGIDTQINNYLSTYGKFKPIFKDNIDDENIQKIIEKIVFWMTVYGDTKKFVREKIEENYGDILTQAQIKRILGFKIKDWGRLSKEFLEIQGVNYETGEVNTLIRMMWETNDNLMELLTEGKYSFIDVLNTKQKEAIHTLSDYTLDDLDNYYFSAPVKRMIWQCIELIREITHIMKHEPTKIFIEMTRDHQDKPERKESRKKMFLDLYKTIKDEDVNWKKVIETSDSNGKLRSKKMYLYLTQQGRCMYTHEKIDLDNLFNDNLYDIDHIYPRRFVKDDNIANNLVLVKKQVNSHKSDTYPLEDSIYSSQKDYWKYLLDKNLITKEKYQRLTSRNPLTDEQKAGFIARQFVETSQGVKRVADIVKQLLPNTQLVYSKASNVSEFRKQFKLLKTRIVNDFHHAHDAYLNIVVGNIYDVKFTKNPLNFINKEFNRDSKKYHYNLSKMYEWDIERKGKIAWKSGNNGTIVTVKNTLAKNTPLMTRYSFTRNGKLFDATLVSKQSASKDNYVSLKSSNSKMNDVTKYGGYTSVAGSYFFLVEHTLKKKRTRSLEMLPIMHSQKASANKEYLKSYCLNDLKLVEPEILVDRIKIQSLIKVNGFYLHITGKTGDRISVRNSVNLCLDNNWMQYIKKIENYNSSKHISETLSVEENIDLYKILTEKHKNAIYSKRPNPVGEKLEKHTKEFETLSLENQCEVLIQILKLSSIGLETANLKLLGESPNTGKMLISKYISKYNEFKLINQSITGVYQKEVDLLSNELANSSSHK